jgi:hypothetical protein
MPEIEQEVLIDLLELLQDMKKAGYVHVNPHHQSYLLTELERYTNTISKPSDVTTYFDIMSRAKTVEGFKCDFCSSWFPVLKIADEDIESLRSAVKFTQCGTNGEDSWFSPAECVEHWNTLGDSISLCWDCAEGHLISDHGLYPNYDREPIIRALMESKFDNGMDDLDAEMDKYLDEDGNIK